MWRARNFHAQAHLNTLIALITSINDAVSHCEYSGDSNKYKDLRRLKALLGPVKLPDHRMRFSLLFLFEVLD